MTEETGGTATESPPKDKDKDNKDDEAPTFEPVLPAPSAEEAKTTRLYELMIILDPAEATRTWDKLTEWVKELIEGKHGGSILRVDKWAESKKLAYEMNGLKRGTFMLVWMRAKPEATTGLERDLRLDERAIRHLMLVHEDEPPGVGKSAEDMEQAHGPRDRDDRDRGDRGDRDRDRDRGDRGDRRERY